MTKDIWRKRLEQLIKDRNFNMKGVSLKAKLNETAVRDIIKRDTNPTIDTLLKIAEVVGVSASYIIDGDERFAQKIPVIGYASGGEGWTPVEDLDDTLEMKLNDCDPIAIAIRGDSMNPVYRNGDHLICDRVDGANIHNIVGRDCIVYTSDGESYVKILNKGSSPTTYNLRSYNPIYPDIEDVKIKWAAPVVWIKRNNF